ncbi:MAG: AraC family transcriptional regulator, partial [Myxococcota bacterium]
LLGMPVRELTGGYADLVDVLGRECERWVTRVRTARRAEDALTQLEAGLRGAMRRRSRRSAIEQACSALAHGVRVGSVADRLGASQRRFSRTFTDETGLTPKQYTRLARFQRALRELRREGLGDVASLALRTGYVDQAHLNHEFRAFAGMTPTEVVAGRGPFTNHVRVSTSDASARGR